MSDNMDFYQSPQTEPREEQHEESFGAVTKPMMTSMQQTSSWVRFLAICGFIVVGLYAVPGVIFSLVFSVIGLRNGGSAAAELGMHPLLFSVIILVVFTGMGVLLFIPLRFLNNFGSKLRTFVQTNNESAMESAFKNNASFWKFCGIVTIVSYALIPVLLIIAIVLGVLGALYV